MLGISHVEHFPPECQLLFLAPGHGEDLAKPRVQNPIARRTQYIALTSLSRVRGAVTLIGSDHIATEYLGRSGGIATRRAGRDRRNLRHVALHFPVCRPLPRIIGLAIWQPGIPPVDTGKLPAANEGIQAAVHVASEVLPPAKGHLIDSVYVDDVPDIEVGVGIVVMRANGILNKRAAVCIAGLES